MSYLESEIRAERASNNIDFKLVLHWWVQTHKSTAKAQIIYLGYLATQITVTSNHTIQRLRIESFLKLVMANLIPAFYD